MDLAESANSLYREDPVKVNYDGSQSTEVLSSLDAGTDCAEQWSLYTYGLSEGDPPVHSGHMSTTAMLKVNFAQTWGGAGLVPAWRRSAGIKRYCVFLQRASNGANVCRSPSVT